MFRELKAGDTLYVLNRTTSEFCRKPIVSVTGPRVEKISGSPTTVVDIAVDNTTYTMADSTDIAYTGNLVVTADERLMSREVETRLSNDKAALANVDAIKEEIPKLEAIYDELNPDRKAKKENEARLTSLEKEMSNINSTLRQLVSAMSNGKKGVADEQGRANREVR